AGLAGRGRAARHGQDVAGLCGADERDARRCGGADALAGRVHTACFDRAAGRPGSQLPSPDLDRRAVRGHRPLRLSLGRRRPDGQCPKFRCQTSIGAQCQVTGSSVSGTNAAAWTNVTATVEACNDVPGGSLCKTSSESAAAVAFGPPPGATATFVEASDTT